ncbi:PIN domain-containing protein [Sphingobium naphthae]|uniref:PIN domain-containing protein n=1 Tax=Sphingobium naphthae TaxID=1886786 RepID=UPI003747BF2B
MIPIAVLDANILFPMILRDTLLRVAAAGGFRAHWSDRILEEMTRNLVEQHRISPTQADRLVAQMNMAFPESSVEDWKPFELTMQNDPKDRHVAAAAARCGAALIVTANLKDFEPLPAGIAAIGPDTFLRDRFAAMPEAVLTALRKQVAGYRNPPATIETLLAWLEKDLPEFVAAVRSALDQGESP